MKNKSMDSKILEMKNISKSFGSLKVLDGIDLLVEKGEIISLIGSSGSGKSTILRCVAGLEELDGGSINFLGKNKKHQVGMVFQQFNLFPHYTVLENIINPMIVIDKKDRKIAREEGTNLLKKISLEEKMFEYPNRLSGGQKQRVAIARALGMNSQILLFDEPTSSLDPELSLEVFEVIRSLKKEGITMIIVTHEMKFAEEISDRIVFIEDGKIVEQNVSNQFFNNPQNIRTKAFLNKVK